MTNFIALAMEPESETSFISYRVIDVESYKEGEILPYYRYVGIIEDEEPIIPDDNEDNNDNSGDSDNNSEIILPQNPVNPSLGCAGSVVVTFNSLVVLCALIIHIKKKRS